MTSILDEVEELCNRKYPEYAGTCGGSGYSADEIMEMAARNTTGDIAAPKGSRTAKEAGE